MKKLLIFGTFFLFDVIICMERPRKASVPQSAASSAEHHDASNLEKLLTMLPQLPPRNTRSAFEIGPLSYVYTVVSLENFARDIESGKLQKIDARTADLLQRELRKYFESTVFDVDLQWSCEEQYPYATVVLAFIAQQKFQMTRELAQLIEEKLQQRKAWYEKCAAEVFEASRRKALLVQQLITIADQAGRLDGSISPIPQYAKPEEFFGVLNKHKRFDSSDE